MSAAALVAACQYRLQVGNWYLLSSPGGKGPAERYATLGCNAGCAEQVGQLINCNRCHHKQRDGVLRRGGIGFLRIYLPNHGLLVCRQRILILAFRSRNHAYDERFSQVHFSLCLYSTNHQTRDRLIVKFHRVLEVQEPDLRDSSTRRELSTIH